MPEDNNKPYKETGRGGKDNYHNSKRNFIKTEEQREVAKKLLRETLVAYRKPKVHNDEELAERLDEYFKWCSTDGVIPTVEEMCLYTGYAIQTVWAWESGTKQGFSPQTGEIIKKAKNFMRSFDAKLVTAGELNFLTYCFRAKNYYGMQDKQEIVVNPTSPLGELKDKEALRKRIEASVTDDIMDV